MAVDLIDSSSDSCGDDHAPMAFFDSGYGVDIDDEHQISRTGRWIRQQTVDRLSAQTRQLKRDRDYDRAEFPETV